MSARFWQTKLPFGADDSQCIDTPTIVDEHVVIVPGIVEQPLPDDRTDFGVATERNTTEIEQLTAVEGEENMSLTIQTVINPADGAELPLEQATSLGIILLKERLYVNTSTGENKTYIDGHKRGSHQGKVVIS